MKMREFYKLSFIVSILGIAAGCSSPKNVVNNWQDKHFVADGNDSDWGENVQYDSKSKFWYKLSNDDNDLYIMLKTEDETLKRKMLMLGLTVWIDSTDHEKEKLGIHYPKGGGRESMPNFRERAQNEERNTDRMKERLFEELQLIEFYGFFDRDDDVMTIGESRIKPAITFGKNNALIYECVLPLRYIFKGNPSKRLVSIGFVTGHMETPNYGGQGRGMEGGRYGGGMNGGGRMPGGRSGYGGGGRSGGNNGQSGKGRVNMEELSHVTKCWIKNYSFSKNKT